MTLTLRGRLTLVYTCVFGLLLTAIALICYHVLAQRLDSDATANLEELARGLRGYLRVEDGVPRLVFDRTDPQQAAFVHEATRYYQIFDIGTGRLLVQSDPMVPLGLHFTPAEVRGFGEQPMPRDLVTDFGKIRLSSSLFTPEPGGAYLLQVGASLDAMDRTLEQFFALLLWTVPAGLAAAALAGRWTAGLALQPLGRLVDATRAIDITDLRRRLPVRGTGDELDRVARAFNDTLGRLERAVEEMRQWSMALAHELRTPLTALRGEIEMAMQRPDAEDRARRLVSQLEEIDRLKKVIDQLLTLARAEAGEIAIAQDSVDLAALAASLCDQLELVAQARGIGLGCESDGDVVVVGDASWLERLVLNLLDNAIKFTPDGGRVTLRVTSEGDRARLEVEDTGIGMSPDEVPRIFERFYRADPARSPAAPGAGLGLSLVKWIVDRHRGRIEVESRPGEGSRLTVRLPLAPPPRPSS